MVNTQTVSLSSSTSISLSGIAPLQLSIVPSNIVTSNKIYRLDYDFGDGTKESVSLYYDSIGGEHSPKNFGVLKQYNLTDAYAKSIPIKVSAYQIGQPLPTVFSINLNLYVPSLEDLGTGVFESFHLNSVKMFGGSDNILYIFETVNPRYLLPVLVNWNKRPITKETVIDHFYRPYRLLSPAENEQATPIGIGGEIQTVGEDTVSGGPDYGTF